MKLTADDLECSEGGIHDFRSYLTGRDVCKLIFCCPCVCIFELFCDCSLCGAVRDSYSHPPRWNCVSSNITNLCIVNHSQRDPERDGFGPCGRASGKKPCVKCGMSYEKAKNQLATMTDDEKQRVWNATYGEENVYTTRAQEHELHRLEVVASHSDDQQRKPASGSPYPRQPQPDAGQSAAPPPYHS
ncbi:hypothetical protein BC937DRAFT_88807 [Endogone sp. FLAS-F59071]|nr:hypothetical protein BC937DRAFT_88807 [Endogone sp. FLAS-F59071]|eukprot:RUS22479.1 hypothetical protein BC937DRAFT_88807 [Endogone sp. FLAS-F59071]